MNIPQHIAIIMDGNGRWAKKRLFPRSVGHWFGVKRAKEIVYYASEIGVKYLTLFAFGRENWKRPEEEISLLMKLLAEQIDKGCGELHQKNIRVRSIGDKTRLASNVLARIIAAEEMTMNNTGLHLDVAIDYSGQFDIIQAVNKIITNEVSAPLSEADFASYLLTYPNPPPDLIIRTSGESRLSNFLLFQAAYSECYFVDTLWPAFSRKNLDAAIKWFNAKERRFGMISEQLERIKPRR
jgi:undecaprenyl diphosphate synthase